MNGPSLKQTISGLLVESAIGYTRRAGDEAKNNMIESEVPWCISAHLMVAVALEGIASEIGALIFAPALLRHFDRATPVLKWYVLSGYNRRVPFELHHPPLQIVDELTAIRNRIAHPKVEDMGGELIIRSASGGLRRNVPLDDALQPGDNLLYGYGKALDTFNFADTRRRVIQALTAMSDLHAHLSVSGFAWVSSRLKDAQRIPQ